MLRFVFVNNALEWSLSNNALECSITIASRDPYHGTARRAAEEPLLRYKAGCCYSGVLREWGRGIAQVALLALEEAILQHAPGHNGISLAADDGTLLGDSERYVGADAEWLDEPV